MKIIFATVFALSTVSPVMAGEYQPGYSTTRTCTRSEYREEYVPGTEYSPGYVRSWKETVEVPCNSTTTVTRTDSYQHNHNPNAQLNEDTNDCSEGSLIGGLLGAGLATAGSRGRDQWWAIPAGGAAGALIGCQIDGG